MIVQAAPIPSPAEYVRAQHPVFAETSRKPFVRAHAQSNDVNVVAGAGFEFETG